MGRTRHVRYSGLEAQQQPGQSRYHAFVGFFRVMGIITRRWMPGSVEELPDDFEKFMQDKEGYVDSDLRSKLLNDYAYLKERPGSKLMSSMVFYQCFSPKGQEARISMDSRFFSPTGSFSDCFSNLQSCLEKPNVNNFQICAIASESPLLRQSFSSVQTFSSALSGRQEEMMKYPEHALVLLVAHHWQLSGSTAAMLIKYDLGVKQKWVPKLPSKTSLSSIDYLDSNETISTLKWQVEVPKYVSDLDIYVWQRFRKDPPANYAQIIQSSTSDAQEQKLVILFRSASYLPRFKKILLDSLDYEPHQWLAIDALLRSVLAVCTLIVEDTSSFVEGISDQIEYLVRFDGSVVVRNIG
jgi:hypothetical protein